MENSRDIKNDVEHFLNNREEIVHIALCEYIEERYDSSVASAIIEVITNDNQIIVGLEDMTTFNKEIRDKLDIIYGVESERK